ncbi:restriction endonuclease subunit S [Acidovorax sp. FG27]|uniref:restriction endonuclease subunit S n=1 Tax=Acidovorax sp. FG27 TaxID=3133652 RepID=UPI0030E8DA2F
MNQLTELNPVPAVEVRLPSNWQSGELLDFLELQRGVDLPVQDRRDGTVPIFGSNGLLGSHDVGVSDGPGVITGRSGTIGKVFYSESLYWPLNTSLYVRDFKGNLPKFVYYKLDAVGLERFSTGTGVPTLNRNVVHKEPVVFPPLHEQQKIAAILTAVDGKLDVIARQIEATQTLKQGLMQTLFTRGAGTQDAGGRWVPHTEFKDSEKGEIPATWEVRSLNDVVDNLDRQRVPLKQADRAQRQGMVPYYGASGVIDWIDDFIFDGDFILLGEDGENVLSRKLPLAFRATGKIWVNNHAHVFRPKAGYDIQFLVELLESLDYSTLASGTAQPKITQQALNQLRFAVPPLDEQVRIGSLLETVAEKIVSLRLKHKRYNALKRGLMQKLLTGEWRVKVDAEMAA